MPDLDIVEVRPAQAVDAAAISAVIRCAFDAYRGRLQPTPSALSETEELCVCDLAWIAGRSQNLVSHHLRALRSHGLVESRRSGKMVMYSLTPAGRTLLGAVLSLEVAS